MICMLAHAMLNALMIWGHALVMFLCTYFLQFFQFLPYSIKLQSLALHFNQKPGKNDKRKPICEPQTHVWWGYQTS